MDQCYSGINIASLTITDACVIKLTECNDELFDHNSVCQLLVKKLKNGCIGIFNKIPPADVMRLRASQAKQFGMGSGWPASTNQPLRVLETHER